MSPKGERRTCASGHTYYKSSDCPVCPTCEAESRPRSGFLSEVSAPARRALEREGITDPAALSEYSEDEVLRLHGLGPSTMPTLKAVLAEAGLEFRTT